MRNLKNTIRNVISIVGWGIPEYELYFRVGMYHFGMVANVSSSVDFEIASFTVELFRDLSRQGKASDFSKDTIDYLNRAITAHLCMMRSRGMHKEGDWWFGPGERMPPDCEPRLPLATHVCNEEDDKVGNRYHNLVTELQLYYGDNEGRFLAGRVVRMFKKYKDKEIVSVRHALDEGGTSMDEYWCFDPTKGEASVDKMFEFYDPETEETKQFWYGFNYKDKQ